MLVVIFDVEIVGEVVELVVVCEVIDRLWFDLLLFDVELLGVIGFDLLD